MYYLSFLFHLYQPPTQLGFVIDKITEECYRPLTDLFTSSLAPRFTVNINYSLTELLLQRSHHDVINNLKSALNAGNLEFVDSGAYHPIFPLIPESEVIRQLKINFEGNRAALGDKYKPRGIFPPEMCYSSRIAKIVKKIGYEWIITDDLPFSYYGGKEPERHIAEAEGCGVFLRSNKWSNNISFHQWKGNEFIDKIEEEMSGSIGERDGYLIIAMDAETFGHHHKYYHEKFIHSLMHAIKNKTNIKLATISEIFEKFKMKKAFVPPSTWSASMQDLYSDDPYPLWQSKFNPIHHNQWQLTYHVLRAVIRSGDETSRLLMDKALYSCQNWWASLANFDPSQIYRGAYLLLDTLEAASAALKDGETLRLGRELYNNLVYSVFARINSNNNGNGNK